MTTHECEITYTVEELVNERWVGDGFRYSALQAARIRFEQLRRRGCVASPRLVRITETRTVIEETPSPNTSGEPKP